MHKFLIPFFIALFVANTALSQGFNYEEVTYGYDNVPKENCPDVFPAYPEGLRGVMNYLCENLSYPKEAYSKKIEGRVVVKFMVNINGEVSDAEVMKSVHPLLDTEAIRVLSSMTGFKPAYINGEAVPFWFYLPVTFKIPD